MKLLETKEVLDDMLENWVYYDLNKKQRSAIKRSLTEIEITIDNGDEGNL